MKTPIAVMLTFATALMLSALPARADRMDELKKEFQDRHPRLQQLKSAGTIGETFEGYVDFVKAKDPGAAEVVDAENRDRRELYSLIAKKEGVTAEKVAERNAARNFDKARPGEFLKNKDGSWTKKQ